MKYCPKCGKKYPTDLNFCLVDGAPLPNGRDAETLRMNAPSAKPQDEIVLIEKKEVVSIGNYVEFVIPGRELKIKITLKEIAEAELPDGMLTALTSKQLAARLSFETTGILYGGHTTKQLKFNEYFVPVSVTGEEESRTVYFFYLGEGDVRLFRLLVKHINSHIKQAELSIGYFRFTRTATE